jgi:hypothetical protein
VLGIMQAVSKLKLKVNVVGCMALAENAIGESAQHPHDIVKSMKGLTVHIDNTDAEGRLVLADAFTCEDVSPASLPAFLPASSPSYLPACLPACARACLRACVRASILIRCFAA